MGSRRQLFSTVNDRGFKLLYYYINPLFQYTPALGTVCRYISRSYLTFLFASYLRRRRR
jgi:hypothetical protein